MNWDYIAKEQHDLANIGNALFVGDNQKSLDEQRQMAELLKALAKTEILKYPLKVRHSGERGSRDFEIQSGVHFIEVEMAKVTNKNLENARYLQSKLPKPRLHFNRSDIFDPVALARKLKRSGQPVHRYVAERLPKHIRSRLETWRPSEPVHVDIQQGIIVALNIIIDGPPLAQEVSLRLYPDSVPEVEGFENSALDNKHVIEEAFLEELSRPLNPTLMVHRFVNEEETHLKRADIIQAAFAQGQEEFGGPTFEEEEKIWLQAVKSEVQDKTLKFGGNTDIETWLVLWDLFNTTRDEIESRQPSVSQLLRPYWKQGGWFTRVFIQERSFSCQLMATSRAIERLVQ